MGSQCGTFAVGFFITRNSSPQASEPHTTPCVLGLGVGPRVLHSDKECYQKQSNLRAAKLQLTRKGEVNTRGLKHGLSSLSAGLVDGDLGQRPTAWSNTIGSPTK